MGKTHATGVDPEIYQYILHNSLRDQPVLKALRDETATLAGAAMQITPDEGQFLALLAQLIQAKTIIEVGVFTGYSALCMAQALPDDGQLYAFDINPTTTGIAKRYWAQAGVADKIDLRLGPAVETLPALIAEIGEGRADMAFIDADKPNHPRYVEDCLTLVRTGGLIVIDNILMEGTVLDPTDTQVNTAAMRDLNRQLHQDQRVSIATLSVADGMTLAVKR